MVPAIKADLHLTDTQISLLQGFAFAVFYGVMSLPLGWAADRWNRRNLIIFGIISWSIATVACGLATNFPQLLLARMAVGIGEAALIPAAFSIVADYFAPAQRGRALGVFSVGLFAGAGLAFIVGGALLNGFRNTPLVHLPILGEIAIWKAAFVLVGVPGSLVALLVLTVAEPPRRALPPSQACAAKSGSGNSLLRYFLRHPGAFFCVWGSYTLLSFGSFAASAWSSTLVVRRFGTSMGDAGLTVGLASMVGGILGCLLGGWLGDRWTRLASYGGKFRATLVWWVGSVPAILGFALLPNRTAAAISYAFYFFFNAIGYVSAAAVIQEIVPAHMRGRAAATWLLLTGVIGQGFGPMAVALATDHVFSDEAAVPYSLLLVNLPAAAVGIVLSIIGLRYYERARTELDETRWDVISA